MTAPTLTDELNEHFGTDYGPADQLLFDQLVAVLCDDPAVRAAACANPLDRFTLVVAPRVAPAFAERWSRQRDIRERVENDPALHNALADELAARVRERSGQ